MFRKKREKNTIFSYFLWDFVQKAQKTLFFRIFCELCTKCLEIRGKTLFSRNSCGISCKNFKKTLFFFAFCANFSQNVSKNVKNTFLPFFVGHRAKSQKGCFSHFLLTLYKASRKTWKKHCFISLSVGYLAKTSKRLFFAFFANFVQSVAKNEKKNTVFSHFLWDVLQKAHKTMFFAFFANFVQSVSKNEKKQCFLTLSLGHRAKS